MEITTVNPGGGTVMIPISFVVDRDFFSAAFPIRLQSDGDCTVGGTNNKLYTSGSSEITEFMDVVYGPVIVIIDQVTYTYLPGLEPGTYSCNIGVFLDHADIQRNPLFSVSVTYRPGKH